MNPIRNSRQLLTFALAFLVSVTPSLAAKKSKSAPTPAAAEVLESALSLVPGSERMTRTGVSSESLFHFEVIGKSLLEDGAVPVSVTAKIQPITDWASLQDFDSAMDEAVQRWGYSSRLTELGRVWAWREYRRNTPTGEKTCLDAASVMQNNARQGTISHGASVTVSPGGASKGGAPYGRAFGNESISIGRPDEVAQSGIQRGIGSVRPKRSRKHWGSLAERQPPHDSSRHSCA
jgi:hypothetical protein